jgi:DNA-binding response OmpR family regulator
MRTARIVVVDDEPDVLDLLRYNLEKERAQVQTFTNGRDALTAIREQRPDLILSDWMMNDLDGLDLCRLLKRDPDLSRVPFVMLTGRQEEIDVVTALELGADEYLTKPIRVRELMSRIKKMLNRTQSALADAVAVSQTTPVYADKMLSFRDLRINIDHHKAYIAGLPLDLTYTEFKLLQLLISKPGRVYTRSQIMEKINGIDYFATERSVDVQVAGLRKKLGSYKDSLETVRGVGYRINDEG